MSDEQEPGPEPMKPAVQGIAIEQRVLRLYPAEVSLIARALRGVPLNAAQIEAVRELGAQLESRMEPEMPVCFVHWPDQGIALDLYLRPRAR